MSDLVRTKPVEFNLHSCYYRDFFLMRTPISINGRPARIEVVEGVSTLLYGSKPGGGSKSVELSTISVKAVGPVLAKHGVYHIDTYYHDQLSLYLTKFLSKSSLKRFLSDKVAVQKELSSAIAKVCAVDSKDRVSVDVKLYLVSPTADGSSPEVHQVNLGNYPSIARTWEESKLFDFNTTMFTDGAATEIRGVCDIAELADLHRELMGVIAWFSLGVQLKIPTHELLAIRKDYHYQTVDCRREMLVRWEQLETRPTWSKLVSALVTIGRKGLAEELAVKYGLPHPFQAVSPSAKESVPSEILQNEQKLIYETKQLDSAKQSQHEMSRRLEKQVGDEVPRLEARVQSLMKETKILRKQLKNRNEELEMFEEFKPSASEEQLQVLDRLVKEKSDQIKSLEQELNTKEKQLQNNRETIKNKEREIARLMDKLSTKSAQVLQLEENVEKLKQTFVEQEEEMNRKLIEASAAAVSQKEYLEQLQIQHDCAAEEASKKKEQIQLYNQQLVVKEKEISRLSEKVSLQEQELIRLREELDSRRISEQLGRENEDEDRAHQLLNSTTRLKLQLQQTQVVKNQQQMGIQTAQHILEKHERVIDQSNLTMKLHLEQKEKQKNLEIQHVKQSLEKKKGAMNLSKLTLTKAPTTMSGGSCAVIGKVAYFNPADSHAIYTFNSTSAYTGEWGKLPTDCPCENSTLVNINQELSSVGGEDTTTGYYSTTNKVLTYRDGRWAGLYPPMANRRQWATVLSTSTVVIATGGYFGCSRLTSTEVLNLTSTTTPLQLQWATAAPLPYGTNLATTTVIGNHIYLIGGYTDSSDFSLLSCDMEQLLQSATTETHRQPSSSTATHSKVWHNIPGLPVKWSTCATVRGQLVTLGGRDQQDKRSNTIYRYNQDTNEWIEIGRMDTARSSCLVTALSDNSLLVVGGLIDSGETDETEIATIA